MLPQILTAHYGLIDPIIEPAPRGFVAETYRVRTAAAEYFAKIIRLSRYTEFVESSLPVLTELYAQGITRINYPIPTLTGQLSVTFEDRMLVLFNYIDDQRNAMFDYDWAKYVELLASIHAITPQIQTPIRRTAFEMLFKPDLLMHLNRLWSETFENPVEQTLQTDLLPYRDEITSDLAKLEQFAAQLRDNPGQLVLTHGDAPGNMLRDADGEVYMIDWDDLLLAPRERDTWFHLLTHDEARFLKLYPPHQINWLAYDFYLYWRYFDDLEGFVNNILSPNISDTQKAWNLKQLRQDCFGWLRPLILKRRAMPR